MDELLYAFARWLRSTPLAGFADRLSQSAATDWMVTHFWAIPVIQTLHILAIAAAFGALVMINLRLFGLAGRSRTMAETTSRYLPWIWWGMLALAITGCLMIVGEPFRELINPVFWIKMVLVALAVSGGLVLHKRVLRRLGEGGATGARDLTLAALLVVLWCAIMLCGRWIAYAPV